MACHAIGQASSSSSSVLIEIRRNCPRSAPAFSPFLKIRNRETAKLGFRAVHCEAVKLVRKKKGVQTGDGCVEEEDEGIRTSGIWRSFSPVPVQIDYRGSKTRSRLSPEKLDNWLRDSVVEIVRHIREAPFLMCLYSDNEEEVEMRKEVVMVKERNWPKTRNWLKDKCPDGIILVEELKGMVEEEDDSDKDLKLGIGGSCSECSSSSRMWGLLVQGRGVDVGSCYILRTTKVCSSLGFCTTHFCLVKAKCFDGPAYTQFRDSWLSVQS